MAIRLPIRAYLETWKLQNGQTDEQLAEYIGTTVPRLLALATETVRPGTGPAGRSSDDIRRIAAQHGANAKRLVTVMLTAEPAPSA
jgi:hypothetical protein